VLAVPPGKWDELKALCDGERVEATALGRFVPTGRLTLRYRGAVVGDLAMEFLHRGRPGVVRAAAFTPPAVADVAPPDAADYTADLVALLGAWDVCSKGWIGRQDDHEVQGRTVIKPLTGAHDDGPGDAAVVLPVRGSTRGLAVACGINPRTGRLYFANGTNLELRGDKIVAPRAAGRAGQPAAWGATVALSRDGSRLYSGAVQVDPAEPMEVSAGASRTSSTPSTERAICWARVTNPWPTSAAAHVTVPRPPTTITISVTSASRARPSCFKHAIPKLKDAGYIVWDNTERDYYQPAIELAPEAFRFGDFPGPSPYVYCFTRTSTWQRG